MQFTWRKERFFLYSQFIYNQIYFEYNNLKTMNQSFFYPTILILFFLSLSAADTAPPVWFDGNPNYMCAADSQYNPQSKYSVKAYGITPFTDNYVFKGAEPSIRHIYFNGDGLYL
jgi:hypothetical protein